MQVSIYIGEEEKHWSEEKTVVWGSCVDQTYRELYCPETPAIFGGSSPDVLS